MALSRLVLQKAGHHLHKRALPNSTRWCSSSLSSGAEKPPSSEDSEAAKEQRAAAEESNNKYMERPSEVVLKPTKGQNKVGESWNTPGGISANLKERILGSSRFHKQNTIETTNSEAGRTVSEVMKTKNSPHDTEIDQPNYSIQMPKVIRDSHSCKENTSMSLNFDIIGECSSSDVVEATARNQVEVHRHLDSTELGEHKSTVQASGCVVCSSENLVGLVVSDTRKEHAAGSENVENYSTNVSSYIGGKNSFSNLVGMVASELREKHVGPTNVEYGVSGSLVQSSEAFMDSQNIKKCVTATAASNITYKRSSKDMGQSEVKPESHGQLEEVMLDNIGVLESETKDQSCFTHQLQGKESRILQKDATNGVTIVGSGNHRLDKGTWICDESPGAGNDVGKIPASSDGSQQVGLASMFMRTMNDQKTGKMPSKKKSDALAPNGLLEILTQINETTGEDDMGEGFKINGLIGCIKELPREPLINTSEDCAIPNKTDCIIKRGGSVKRLQSRAHSDKHDAKRRESSLRGHAMGRETNAISESKVKPCRGIPSLNTDSISESDTSNLKVASRKKSKISPQVHLPIGKDLNKIPSTFYQKEGSTESKVLVRFLHKNVKEGNIVAALNDCGDIMKIELLSLIEGSNFRDACVHFKTREGLQKALRKTDLIIEKADIFFEATSLEDVPNQVSIPNVFCDPEVPEALVKNPTRTVMIKQLTHDISSHQLKEALAFCGSGISRFFMGSSSAVAFVEFETEDAKERAIAAHSIDIQGMQLSILRVDVPRTTVIRISNFDETVSSRKILSICRPHGQPKQVKTRGNGIVDVHFKLAEWPNMLTILNSLNGVEVDGYRLTVQPAPVFPPEVLKVLWSQPDGRSHVKSVLRRLLKNTELNVEITDLANKYYKDATIL